MGVILPVLAPIVLLGVVTRFSRPDRWEWAGAVLFGGALNSLGAGLRVLGAGAMALRLAGVYN